MVLAAKVRALLDGRYNVAFDDLRDALLPALRHRLFLNFEADAAGATTDTVLTDVLHAVVADPRVD
jgi:MoxR-like ATPase